MKYVFLSAILVIAPLPALSAPLNYGPFVGTHFHSGGNIGAGYLATSDADRTSTFGPSGSGSFANNVASSYSGDMGAGRIGTGEVTAATSGTLNATGFSIESQVTTSSTCNADPTPVAADCLPFIGMQSFVSFDFSPTADTQLTFSIDWAGGAGDPNINLSDYFSFQFLAWNGFAFSAFGLPAYSTSELGDVQTSGNFSGVLDLFAGNDYRFEIGQRAQSQTNGEVGIPALDSGFFTVEASIAAVPVPASLWLITGALAALVGLRRRAGQGA